MIENGARDSKLSNRKLDDMSEKGIVSKYNPSHLMLQIQYTVNTKREGFNIPKLGSAHQGTQGVSTYGAIDC